MNRRQQRFISKIKIAAFAGAFTMGASAQTSAPATEDVWKQKQEMVKSATASTVKGASGAAADGSAAAAKTRDMRKALPDEASKRKGRGFADIHHRRQGGPGRWTPKPRPRAATEQVAAEAEAKNE
jgi:hypothetical protein